ncbi:MAG UNVERIFIED_CONTAM: hypothetical protein LVR18_03415 [Planctomycetaceae bacterium]|jgi:hypothetical protein
MKQGLKVEQVVVLAGERPLWAQIDGIEPHMLQKLEEAKLGAKSMDEVEVLLPSNANDDRMAEGKNYILYLARKLGSKLNPENPFIMKDGKLYPNYIDQNQPKLTETAMSLDLLEAFGILTEVVDTKSQGKEGQIHYLHLKIRRIDSLMLFFLVNMVTNENFTS